MLTTFINFRSNLSKFLLSYRIRRLCRIPSGWIPPSALSRGLLSLLNVEFRQLQLFFIFHYIDIIRFYLWRSKNQLVWRCRIPPGWIPASAQSRGLPYLLNVNFRQLQLFFIFLNLDIFRFYLWRWNNHHTILNINWGTSFYFIKWGAKSA